MSYSISTIEEVMEKIWSLVHQTAAFDIYSDLCDLRFSSSEIRIGIDELLRTQELTAELFRNAPCSLCSPGEPLTAEEYESMPVRIRSELIWHRLFLACTPLSEATRTVLTSLGLLQLDTKTRNLGAYRNFFSNVNLQQHIETVFKRANLHGIVCPYNPLDKETLKTIQKPPADSRVYTALDLSELVCDWKNTYEQLSAQGIAVKRVLSKPVYAVITDYILNIIKSTGAVYISLKLPSGMSFSSKSSNTLKLLTRCVIPALMQTGKPLTLLFTDSHRPPALNSLKINQPLEFSNPDFIRELIERFPGLKLMAADSDLTGQQRLIQLARNHSSLMPLINNSGLAAQTPFSSLTQMSLDLLGGSFIAHARSATVYEELLGNWAHSRWILGTVLQEKYAALYRTGWRITEQELISEISAILSGNAQKFLNIS